MPNFIVFSQTYMRIEIASTTDASIVGTYSMIFRGSYIGTVFYKEVNFTLSIINGCGSAYITPSS